MTRSVAALLLVLSLSLTSRPVLGAATLTIDASHTAVIFSWHHRGYSHPLARLEQVQGTVHLDTADLSKSSVSVVLPLEGLRTGDAALDRRLRGAEFFEASRFTEITFTSTAVKRAGPQRLQVTGDLRVHGMTQPAILDVRINRIDIGSDQKLTAGFDADAKLRRSDFALGRYVPMVGDELTVHITLEAVE